MRPPRWMEIRQVGRTDDGTGMRLEIRVRWWHPSFWLFAVQAVWETLRGR